MIHTLEIAGGSFLGLFAFASLRQWRARRKQAKLEASLRGLTANQLVALGNIPDLAEKKRAIRNMHAANEAERRHGQR